MKILYVTTIGGTMDFFYSLVPELIKAGHTVDIACNTSLRAVNEHFTNLGCKVYQISCTRSPISKKTFTAIKELKKIVSEGKYDLVHCHTPVASLCARLACRKLRKKNGVKVVYTAHGFHFYKGAPKKNWLIYYTMEKLCSKYTDAIVTINKEDYDLAQKKFKKSKIYYVPGVGINVDKFKNAIVDKKSKRDELGIPESAILFLSVGELNENKNHSTVIKAIASIENPNIYYAIAGRGDKEQELINLAREVGVASRVKVLGYRRDVIELFKTADVFIHPSFREGLPVSIMEAMASGLPIVASKIRGNVDLVDENGGKLFNPHSVAECRDAILNMCQEDVSLLGNYNTSKANSFSDKEINDMILNIYLELSNC